MIEKWTAEFPLPEGSEPRTVYVYLPEAAEDDPEARFPVLYMFDGHNVFFDEDATYGKCWGMKEYMDETGTPLIIVAVDCNHHPDGGRLAEYSPYNFKYRKHAIRGQGKTTMDWFARTLKPMIDEKYPIPPEEEEKKDEKKEEKEKAKKEKEKEKEEKKKKKKDTETVSEDSSKGESEAQS